MLNIKATRQRLCDGTSRRDFLRLGAIGALGLSEPALLSATASSSATSHFGRAKRCLLLFLTGGAPQLDTFDLKPNAPVEYRGELKPIATSVPGMQFSELFPRLARQADQCCIVRSVTHGDSIHTSAGYTMLTGVRHPRANGRSAANIRPGPHDHPHLGAILARARPAADGLPTYASLPEVIKDAGVNTYPGLDGGLLGKQFAPLRIEANAGRTGFQLPDVFLSPQLSVARLAERRELLDRVNQQLNAVEAKGTVADLDMWYQRAFALMRAPAIQQAFDLEREPDRLRDEYGRHLFAQGCLLARRLLEAGLRLVSVYWHYEGPDDSPVWDTHQNNFPHLRNRLVPPTDQALAALLHDLGQRGLLDETLLICMGEFGRTPKINARGGRDHWPAVQSVLLAGAGIRRGTVYGASDRLGAFPADQPVTPADLAATILHLLGVPLDLEIRDHTDRPMAACSGKPVVGVLANEPRPLGSATKSAP